MPNLSDTLSLANRFLPPGTVVNFGFNTVPEGFLELDGTAVSRSTYKALFSAIGTTFGAGDGSTTFNLPNGRGIFVRGTGSQVLSSVTYDGATLGTKTKDRTNNAGISGSTSSTNSASMASNNDAHSHNWTDRYLSAPFPNNSYSDAATIPIATAYSNSEVSRTSGNPSPSLANHTHTIATNTVSSTSTLSSSQTESVPGYLTVKFGIKT